MRTVIQPNLFLRNVNTPRLATLVASLSLVAYLGGQPAVTAQGAGVRRVNVPYFDSSIPWAEASVFWFGRVDPLGAPGKNHADVRAAYTADELVVYVNVQDYYLWYDR